MRGLFLIWLILLTVASATAQTPRVLNVAEYTAQIKTYPEKKLVEIKKVVPGIKLDIRYATKNNFMGRVMYKQARAFARAPVAEALKQIQIELALKGLGIKVFDGYRPYAVTLDFFEHTPDTNFVAKPRFGSKHNRGCALDLTIIDLKTGKDLNMPTTYDSFTKQASSTYADLSPIQLQNRAMLKEIMERHGFTQLPSEWWHFDFNGWTDFELLDVPFEKL